MHNFLPKTYKSYFTKELIYAFFLIKFSDFSVSDLKDRTFSWIMEEKTYFFLFIYAKIIKN
ncbi:hypothetical protein CDIMF43_200295 [Carnobacterium divergens]|nr:hypothetical protein CDIMF43_200295 [Carnobacterium divergens]